MKASLDQRQDYQVKCYRSIQFRATKREVVVKTTTTTTAVAKSIWQCAKYVAEDEAERNPKSLAYF